jgi:hypothetical protein
VSRNQTYEEARQEYIEKLGPELGAVFHLLLNEFWWLQLKWAEYVELFGTSPARIDLANEAAGSFIRIVQDELWESSLLGLCRLTETRKVHGRETLSIKALPALCGSKIDQAQLGTLINKADLAIAFARDWRNRHIGHRDLALALGQAKPLDEASRAKVKTAIQSIFEVLNFVSETMMQVTFWSEPPSGAGRGVVSLLYVLRDGLRARDERDARIKSGKFTHEDIQHQPI